MVQQQKTSMKVCTDACILGSYAAKLAKNLQISSCLDIGTGTGLLSLMLAQDSAIKIDAIDIDKNAVSQAGENFEGSPWSNRLRAIFGDINVYTSPVKYDLIISNPPFYEDDLLSPHTSKNIAKHHGALRLQQLIDAIDLNLSPSGYFFVLLPFKRVTEFEEMSRQKNFFLHRKLLIRNSPLHPWYRAILFFARLEDKLMVEELVIRDKGNNYSDDFISLLKNYYLHL